MKYSQATNRTQLIKFTVLYIATMKRDERLLRKSFCLFVCLFVCLLFYDGSTVREHQTVVRRKGQRSSSESDHQDYAVCRAESS